MAIQNTPRTLSRRARPLRLATYLAPNLFWFYEFISVHLANKLDYPTELHVGTNYASLAGQADFTFVCGLPYVEHTCLKAPTLKAPTLEPLAAPVLKGARYNDKPVYFSDVIVRRDSPFKTFADLRGRSWAYNEPLSQSGYGITRYHLVKIGETKGYFSKVIEAGYHERAIQIVAAGQVDASAIDSHVLALVLRDNPAFSRRLRVIDTFGPSTIQPLVAGSHLSKSLKRAVKKVLLEMADDPAAKPQLDAALVERFESVSDSTYDDIRRMRSTAEAARFLTIR